MVCRRHHFTVPRRFELWYFWCDGAAYMTRLVMFACHVVLRHDYPTGTSAWKVFHHQPLEIFDEIYKANMSCSVMRHHERLSQEVNICCVYCGVMRNVC